MKQRRRARSPVASRLPAELTLFLFSFLELPELCAASLVCKDWHGVASDHALWRNLFAKSVKRLKRSNNVGSPVLTRKPLSLSVGITKVTKQKQIKGLVRDAEGRIPSGSVACLIDEAIYTSDDKFKEEFILTYPTFITRSALFLELLQRYDASLLTFNDGAEETDEGEENESSEMGRMKREGERANVALREGERFFSVEQLREEREQMAKKAYKDDGEDDEEEAFAELCRKKNVCCLLAKWCSSYCFEDFMQHDKDEEHENKENENEAEQEKLKEEEERGNEVALALKIFVRGIVARDFARLATTDDEQSVRLKDNTKEDGKNGKDQQPKQEEKKKRKKKSKLGTLFGRREHKDIANRDENRASTKRTCSVREEALHSLQSIIAYLNKATKRKEKSKETRGALDSEFVVQALLPRIELGQCPSLVWPKKSETLEWSNIPAVELARQMTLLHYFFFSQITRRELLRSPWLNINRAEQQSSILHMTNHFNSVANWVIRSILEPTKPATRAKVITYFHNVILELDKLGSYHALFAIVAGYSSVSVHRLKQTRAHCPQKTIEAFNSFDNYRLSAHKQLREVMAARTPPLIPYLGMYLTDLLFISDGNPDMTANNLINFRKRVHLSTTISAVKRFQQHPFHLQPIPEVIHFLLHLPSITEEECIALSLNREPRKT